ncbi:MAG: P-loop NTPase [Ignisphaera sp.]|uniref:ATP-binding protein n=1 Tax=Ignisphaera aggregans TaxID=334771 RepID=A0A7J3MYC3_9CREN
MTIDPRIFLASSRLSVFKYIVPVLSPKGGVGKSTVATALSLVLTDSFGTVSLVDLDINNPTAHIILGVDAGSLKIEEDKGILPIKLFDSRLEFMSITLFTRDKLVPLRGRDISNAILEILAITRWSGKVLIVDTPPGFSDEVMDLMRIKSIIKPIIVSTTDKLSLYSASRLIELLKSEDIDILGIVGNMCKSGDIHILETYLQRDDVIACIPKIDGFDKLYGRIDTIYELFKQHLMKVVKVLITR